jgi:3-oxoacid CoA-transferase subunit A
MIYITGDIHRYFDDVEQFCLNAQTTTEDVLVLLGDAEINCVGDPEDREIKEYIATFPITLLCVHGNHEKRPEQIPSYKEIPWNGGTVYAEDGFPNILFAKCGEVYTLEGMRCMPIGGAYSVDKDFRLTEGIPWFADEQPSAEIMKRVNERLQSEEWQIDWVFAHTCPYKYLPRETFLYKDEHLIDQTTEKWLDTIEDRLTYSRWFCGHFHIDKHIDKLNFLSGMHFIKL